MQRRPIPPTAWEIYSAWKSLNFQGIEESELEYFEDTPVCFACGHEFRIPSLYKTSTNDKKWNNARATQRAHIIPFSLGGNNSPLNYLILCEKCHLESPDIKDREIMLHWCNHHDIWMTDTLREMFVYCKNSLNAPKTEEEVKWVKEIFESYRKKDELGIYFKEWMMSNISSHFGEGVKTSSFIEGVLKFAKDTYWQRKILLRGEAS